MKFHETYREIDYCATYGMYFKDKNDENMVIIKHIDVLKDVKLWIVYIYYIYLILILNKN